MLGADAMVVEANETAIGAEGEAKVEVEAEADKDMETVFSNK